MIGARSIMNRRPATMRLCTARRVAALALCALGVAACGGGGDGSSAAAAAAFGEAHEAGSTDTAAASAMDLHNNAAGRALVAAYPAASDAQLLELITQQRFTLVAAPAAIPPGTAGLVFIAPAAERTFDARFTGTFDESDGGGAWQAEAHFNQCGALIRGHFTLTRGAQQRQRRFTGPLSGPAQIDLQVADPHAFEAAGDGRRCEGMTISLSATAQALSGNWAAPGCAPGGALALARG
jgi:hypothetical protein